MVTQVIGVSKVWNREITKGQKETLGGDENIHYFDRDDLMGISICQNLSNCAIERCGLL